MKMETYKEYEIHVESNGSFEALKEGEVVFREDTLKVLKEKIDVESKKSVRQPCLVSDWGEIHNGTITSVIEEKGGYGTKTFDVWVSWERKESKSAWGVISAKGTSRGKKAFYDLYKPTEGNKNLFAEIEVVKKQIEEMTKRKVSLEEKLIHFSAKDFGYKDE